MRGRHASPATAAPESSSIGNTRDASPGMTLARFRGVSGVRGFRAGQDRPDASPTSITHASQPGWWPATRPAIRSLPTRALRAGAVNARRPRGTRGRSGAKRAQSIDGDERSARLNGVMAGRPACVQHAPRFVRSAGARGVSWTWARSVRRSRLLDRCLITRSWS